MLADRYGWTHDEIMGLTVGQFGLYIRQVERLEARDQLRALEASIFPQLEKVDRKAIMEQYLGPKQIIKKDIEESWKALRLGIYG